MKKILAFVLAVCMVMAMAACTTQEPKPTDPAVTTPVETTPVETTIPVSGGLEQGTCWNAVAELRTEEDETSVWQYYFYDATDASFNPMGVYDDHDGSGIAGWYPWEGSWVGVGTNADVQGYLEMNTEGAGGMCAVLGFKAPADGKYVVTGAVMNPWGQSADLFTVAKADGTVVTTEDILPYEEVNGYITPSDVELKEGEVVYFYCFSTNDWVSAYSNITVYYDPTDASVYEKPEVVIPEKEEEFVPNVEGATYAAAAEFTSENADGLWVYASTTDGVNYTVAESYNEPDWTGDGNPNAAQWYSANGTGMGFNFDCGYDWIECNVTDAGGEIMALGFKAPAAGKYTLTVFTQNKWGQNSESVVLFMNGEEVGTVAFAADPTEGTFELEMNEGDIVYIHGTSNGGWVSTYVAAFVVVG